MQSAESLQQLTVAVSAKQAALDQLGLAHLRERVASYATLYANVYNVLRRKGQIGEDPYKDEDPITEVSIPARKPYSEQDRRVQSSIRFGQLLNQLEFIKTYYSFTTAFLDFNRARPLGELVRYIDWSRLAESAADFMTAELGGVCAAVRSGNDKLSTRILNDAVRQLSAVTVEIIGALKELTAFHRQHYKLMLRITILDAILADQEASQPADIDRLARQPKRKFVQSGTGQPFYPELAREVLGEELGDGHNTARKRALDALRVDDE